MVKETLYCVDKKGELRVFQGKIINSNTSGNGYVIGYGKLFGKLTTKEFYPKGRQGRDNSQQAIFELNSAYKEKRDEGYKSLADIEQRYTELGNVVPHDYYMIPESDKVGLLLSKLKVKFNSNADWYLLPMLAEKWRDHKKKVIYPVIVQAKLNGVRCVAFWSKKSQKVVLMSRGGDYYIVPHIQKELEKVLKDNQDVILDGELYKHNVPLQTISGVCRLEQLDLLDARQSFLEYWVYDLPDLTSSQSVREQWKNDFMSKHFAESDYIFELHSDIANNEAEVLAFHDAAVDNGYEGCMVRSMDSLYQFSFRDTCLLKVKNYIDEEFEILGCEADNTTANSIGESFVFVMKNNEDEQEFKARPTGSLSLKVDWYNNMDKLIGKKATVRFQERSKDNLPIQGHVRHKDSKPLVDFIHL